MIKNRKKTLFIFLAFFLLFANCSSSNLMVEAASKETVAKPTKITLNYKTYNLSPGENVTLKVKNVKPGDASKSVVWSSSNKKIATVSSKGKVKAKKTGNVTITATSKGNKKVVAKCKIRVYKATKKLKLNSKKSYTLAVGDTQKLSAKVTNPKKGAAPVTWSSGNKGIAKVSKNGKVTAVSQGETTITAKSGKKKVKVKITVKASEQSQNNESTPDTTVKDHADTETTVSDSSTSEEQVKNQIVQSGGWNGMTWTIDEEGTFTISEKEIGEGASENGNPAWSAYAETIKTAVVTAENVTSTENWFYGCTNLTSVDLRQFDTGNVTTMKNMFMGCTNLISVDVSGFDTSKVTDMSCMFAGCTSLTGLNVSNFDTGSVTDMSGMFWLCKSLTSVDVSNFCTSNVTTMESMFENCNSLTNVDVSNFNTDSVKNMGFLFSGCSNLTAVDVSQFNTGSVTNMRGMFQRCSSLTCIDVSNFQTGKVTDMGYMFSCCSSLKSADISGFDKSQVTDMEYMFQRCDNLQQ